jgi:hypothetical protein
MSIAGTYSGIRGVVSDYRRRLVMRGKKSLVREVWVIDAEDILENISFTILIDSRYNGVATATPDVGTRKVLIVSGPLPNEQLRALSEAELVDLDLEIEPVYPQRDFAVRNLCIRTRMRKADTSIRGGKGKDDKGRDDKGRDDKGRDDNKDGKGHGKKDKGGKGKGDKGKGDEAKPEGGTKGKRGRKKAD